MELSKKQVISGVLVLFLLGAAVGKYTLPAKVVTKTEIKIEKKEVIKWRTKSTKNESKNKDTIIIETRYPDGTVKRETRIVDKGTIVINKTDDKSQNTDTKQSEQKESTTTYAKNDLVLSLMAATSSSNSSSGVSYGLSAQKRIIGPIYLGGFGFTDKTIGISLGVSF